MAAGHAHGSGATRGALFGLGAAVLFGCGTPLAKLLLAEVHPLPLAGLLYLGGGAGVLLVRLLRRGANTEAPLQRADAIPLLSIVTLGGIVGPLLLLIGLSRTSGFAASLLLNLEAPFTIGIALLVFREHLGLREAVGAVVIVVGGALLGAAPGGSRADPLGAVAVAAACLAWGIDNNLSQRLSKKDPIAIALVKTLGAGTCSLGLAAALGDLPPRAAILPALAVGSLSYGISVLFDLYALRLLGAAREAAWFATAPFFGAGLSIALLAERPDRFSVLAGLLILAGVAALRTSRHGHLHRHAPLVHEHAHVHDEHHRHAHPDQSSVHAHPHTAGEPHAHADEAPHSHPHEHDPLLEHDHPHVSDEHHRHGH